MKKDDIKRLAGEMTDMLNSFSTESSTQFLDMMTREHRTLQQSFTKLCMMWLEHCASDEYRYDDRNKASHEVSKRMVELYEDFTENVFKFRGTPSRMLPTV
jgi:hypothetical protein